VFLSYQTDRADPILRNVLKRSSGCNPALRIPICRIINISADNTNISIHIASKVWGGDGKFGANELTIAELNAGESTEVITRFATAFNMQEETIVVELSDATGKNDTFRYITYYEGRMNTPRGFDGESAAYNPYMNRNMAAMYGGGHDSRSQRQQIRPHIRTHEQHIFIRKIRHLVIDIITSRYKSADTAQHNSRISNSQKNSGTFLHLYITPIISQR
jgi:hypothetical protein